MTLQEARDRIRTWIDDLDQNVRIVEEAFHSLGRDPEAQDDDRRILTSERGQIRVLRGALDLLNEVADNQKETP